MKKWKEIKQWYLEHGYHDAASDEGMSCIMQSGDQREISRSLTLISVKESNLNAVLKSKTI